MYRQKVQIELSPTRELDFRHVQSVPKNEKKQTSKFGFLHFTIVKCTFRRPHASNMEKNDPWGASWCPLATQLASQPASQAKKGPKRIQNLIKDDIFGCELSEK